MAVSLRTYLNNQLKAKGLTVAQAKKNASKYKSIAAAKKAGSLYYTDKNNHGNCQLTGCQNPPLKPNTDIVSGTVYMMRSIGMPNSFLIYNTTFCKKYITWISNKTFIMYTFTEIRVRVCKPSSLHK